MIIHFVLYLFCEIPLQCSANGILGTLPRSSNSKESTNVLFGQTSENNNDEQHQNVSVIRNSQVKHKTLEYFIYINKKCHMIQIIGTFNKFLKFDWVIGVNGHQ